MKRIPVITIAVLAFAATSASAQVQGDPKRGANIYRSCTSCHSLLEDVHLTGPSLAGLWGKKAASIAAFRRYSPALKSADLVWDENSLNAWLSDPQAMLPQNYMTFRGIENEKDRSDLIAFLKLALAPGGTAAVLKQRLLSRQLANGQIPRPLIEAGQKQRVTAIRKCGDTYFIKLADGKETPYWEMNVRLKIDTSERGPKGKGAVLAPNGMQGDRVSIVFSRIAEIGETISQRC